MVFAQNTIMALALSALLAITVPVTEASRATMYWDCCKPSGSWKGKADVYNPVNVCAADGRTLVTGPRREDSNSSGCGGGFEYQCSCQQPWADEHNRSLGYAFAAFPSSHPEEDTECGCYVAEFKGAREGKIDTLFLQVINDGGDLASDSFDILVPGMGVGYQTQGCASQWKTDTSSWGKQYGGLDQNAAGCANLPRDLQAGCNWKFRNWGNSPELVSAPRRVRCSKGHIDRSGCQRKDDQKQPVFTVANDGSGAPAPDNYRPDRSVCGGGGYQANHMLQYNARKHHK